MMRLHDFLAFRTQLNPDADFAIFEDKTMSYREADEQSNRIANALLAQGLKKGDRIAYLSKNSMEYPVIFFGCSKAGVVPVPLNYRLAAPEWAYIINDAEAKLLLVSGEFAEGVDSVRGDLGNIDTFVSVAANAIDGYTHFADWIASESTSSPSVEVLPEDDVYQMYTSGTTGHPKGAVIRHSNIASHLYQFDASISRASGERTLVVAPLYHAAGGITFMVTIATGGTCYILEDFNPVETVRALSEEGIAHATLVPAMIQACLLMVPDVAERSYDNLKTIAYGASPISEETLKQAMNVFGCDFFQAYGMTETTAVLTVLPADAHERAVNGEPHLLLSAGRAMLGTQLKIVDDDDNEVAVNTIGEICGRGPQIMRGYWNLDEATEKALQGGWMHTGDAGRIDEEGFLYVEDRVKDMIISGGENVYPREVENCLFQHAAIADAAVIGIPSDKWGETIKAIVVLKAEQEATEEDLIAHCRANIAHFKCPTSVDYIAELPRNASGKVLKRELREKYWEGQGRGVS
ncbi:MAG: long-chain-fatty-acid--CoA ligase [Candidatus Hydrogenedentota bacterium]